ncbi:HI0074 family nucleotidyltransferase substrate-binding subunit [Candidatus Magnetobacterium casense]|uniref:Nucleotidyltransferase substrate binding protein n=1 Tax=Candidatus Magnetobacterium casense TaxID=1455061 RepID=A0ABS6RZJ3_9BACT|nr:HI0074 family nucleotidyltransferase substrate-binding subunit [Candidatus Magnetobacterium casensis]MBV6341454.1 nucleotidyltransferase substrate binding protein [Candidatus Magnetobacterium casensis]
MKPVDYTIDKLQKALLQLRDAADRAVDDLGRDAVIQRFEFTCELFWKAIKVVLEYEKFSCQSPRSCIKEGVRRGLLLGGQTLLDMLQDRNITSHLYDEAMAEEVFQRIKATYINLLEDNLQHIRSRL